MAFFKTCVLMAVMLVGSMLPTADAHGRLLLPAPTYVASAKGKINYWAYGITGDKNPPATDYAGGLGDVKRHANFEKNFVKNGFKSLQSFIMANQKVVQYDGRPGGSTPECGYTNPNGTPQPLPDKLTWPSPTFQHTGPCEAWCDNERVMYAASCKKWEASGGKMTYDKAKCVGKKMLKFYWLATFVVPFQVYTNCVPLKGSKRQLSNATEVVDF
ncbi:hypothetical protein FI667_g4298, partial [Globisporangium splendens]